MKYLITEYCAISGLSSRGIFNSLPSPLLKVSSDGYIIERREVHDHSFPYNYFHNWIIVGYAIEDWEYEAIDSSIYLIKDRLDQIFNFFIKYRFGDIHLDYYTKDLKEYYGGWSESYHLSNTMMNNLTSKYENTWFYCKGGYDKIIELLSEIDSFVVKINNFIKSTIVKREAHRGNGYYTREVLNIPLLIIK